MTQTTARLRLVEPRAVREARAEWRFWAREALHHERACETPDCRTGDMVHARAEDAARALDLVKARARR